MVKFLEWSSYADFAYLGIYPRSLLGSVGILTSPLIHQDFVHLLSNSFPLLLLGVGMVYFYRPIAIDVFVIIYLLTGISVWLIAREAYHLGASGLVYGMVTFIFFSGLLRKDLRSITISLAVIFLYGGMVYGVFPGESNISWESHLMGSAAGIICAFAYRKSSIPWLETTDFEEEESPEDAVSVTEDLTYNINYVSSDMKDKKIPGGKEKREEPIIYSLHRSQSQRNKT